MREEICTMELIALFDRYGEKFILKVMAELVGQNKLEKAKTDFFLGNALLRLATPPLVM